MLIVALLLLSSAPQTAQPARTARDAGERAADARDRTICKRFTETGSLVRGYKICKTKAEWDADRDNLRQRAAAGGTMCPTGQMGC